MNIDITQDQYKELIAMVALANGIVGMLGDVMPEADYKKRSEKMKDLEDYFLQFAADFDCSELAQENEDEGKAILDDEFYENTILPMITDYEEFAAYDTLSNELAWRDFKKDHSEKEIGGIAEKNGGYFGVELYDYEKKYWDEFEEHGYERLEIKE